MDDKPPVFPQWPGEPGHMPDDVKERINELLFYSLPPTVTIGDMETIACRFIQDIETRRSSDHPHQQQRGRVAG
jgi:hypothetical protein